MTPRSTVKLAVLRKGERRRMSMTLSEMPKERQAPAAAAEGEKATRRVSV